MRRYLLSSGLIALLIFATFAGGLPAAGEITALSDEGDLEEEAVRTDLPADILAWLALMPELGTAPAPTWLKVGTRVTYHVMSAAREGDTSPAGESIVQYDVVSIDATTVLAATGVHVIGSGGVLGPVSDTGFVIGAPGVGDVWMNPGALAKAEKHANKDITIFHTTVNIAGAAKKAVRFEYIQGAARSVSVFDEATGVLLYRIQAEGTIETAKQSSLVADFLSIRQLAPAWTGGATPAWASAGTTLGFEGTMVVNLGFGSPGPPMALAMNGQITNSSPAGVCVKWTTYISGAWVEERYSLSSSAIPSGGIFLPQAALTALKAGKVLDTDPITGVTMSVAQQPLSIEGKQLLVIVHEGKSFRRLYGYDRQTGMLTYYSEKPPSGGAGAYIEMRLRGVSR